MWCVVKGLSGGKCGWILSVLPSRLEQVTGAVITSSHTTEDPVGVHSFASRVELQMWFFSDFKQVSPHNALIFRRTEVTPPVNATDKKKRALLERLQEYPAVLCFRRSTFSECHIGRTIGPIVEIRIFVKMNNCVKNTRYIRIHTTAVRSSFDSNFPSAIQTSSENSVRKVRVVFPSRVTPGGIPLYPICLAVTFRWGSSLSTQKPSSGNAQSQAFGGVEPPVVSRSESVCLLATCGGATGRRRFC